MDTAFIRTAEKQPTEDHGIIANKTRSSDNKSVARHGYSARVSVTQLTVVDCQHNRTGSIQTTAVGRSTMTTEAHVAGSNQSKGDKGADPGHDGGVGFMPLLRNYNGQDASGKRGLPCRTHQMH